MAMKKWNKMARPTSIAIETSALLHNLKQVNTLAPGKKVYAMVKANAYGCGLSSVVPVLDGKVDAFGVASLEEALAVQALGAKTNCLLVQGFFSPKELPCIVQNRFMSVIHSPIQLEWLLTTPLSLPIKLWVKVNTGMNRLGFKPFELHEVMNALQQCAWVDKDIGIMTHLACADTPERVENEKQLDLFESIAVDGFTQRSIANSAAIYSFPQSHADVVRPGIMLYGVSPFANRNAKELNLIPVMRFKSAISAIHHNPPLAQVGYGGTWSSSNACVIGIIPVGYGDGYPRRIGPNTPVWVDGNEVPIVGRVSMDMMAVDLTNHPQTKIGTPVELWGENLLVERIAQSAGTIGYELLCQITNRPRIKTKI